MLISKSLRLLLEKSGLASLPVATLLWGCWLACIGPIVIWILGGILSCLVAARTGSDQPEPLSSWLPNPAGLFSATDSLMWRVTLLLAIAVGLIAIASFLLLLFYRSVHQASLRFEVGLMAALRVHAHKLARLRTLSAHQQALSDGLEYHLPRVRTTMTHYWRAYPRHALQALVSVLLAIALEPMLGILSIISAGFAVLVYRFLDGSRRTQLPVIRERAAWNRAQIIELSLKGPLLESVHDSDELESRYQSKLQSYVADAFLSHTSSIWKSSMLLFIGGFLAGAFFFVVAVSVFRDDSSFGVSGTCCFVLFCIAAAISCGRLSGASAALRTIETATDELGAFLDLSVEGLAAEHSHEIQAVKRSAELDHVTVLDSRGRKLLENATAQFSPGKLIGVVADQHLQARALVELLLGLGRPVSGRMMVDGQLVTDLHPDSLAQCGHWVAADGALVAGSVRQNLASRSAVSNSSQSLDELLASYQVLSAVHRLPEGSETVVSAGDDRLASDVPFRLGLARAAMSHASVIVLEEPKELPYDREVERQTLLAMQEIVSDARVTLVLPQRLSTLQSCDEVVMLHEHQVADVGSHSDLIRRNELYRHLNYLKFNPFGEA